MRFQFAGKSGKQWSLSMRDRRIARILRACQSGAFRAGALHYFDEDRELRAVSSGDVNAYLRETAGYDVTAKDFRTWSGTVLMTSFLNEAGAFESQRQMKRLLRAAIVRVAGALGNTPTVCRKSYVHPGLISAYEVGRFALEAEAEGETKGPAAGRERRAGAAAGLERAAADIANASEAIRWTTDGRGRLHQDLVAREAASPLLPARECPRGRRSAANALV